MMTVDDQEGLEASISSSSENTITSSTRRSLVELSSQVFPQTIYRPRLIPRSITSNGLRRKTSVNNIGSEGQPDAENPCADDHLIVDFNGICSRNALETEANTTTTPNSDYYFSPSLIGQEDDEDKEYHSIPNTNNYNFSLDPTTLQYWNDSSLSKSFDLLGVIANDDQDLNTPTADSTSGTFNMVNMLLTSPLDVADQYRTKAARMWEGYHCSVLNSPTHGAAEKQTSSTFDTTEATLEGQLEVNAAETNPTKHIPMAFLEKLEGKSSLMKNFVLMEQQREMRKFLDHHDSLLVNFVSRGHELQSKTHQQRHMLLHAASTSGAYKTAEDCYYDEQKSASSCYSAKSTLEADENCTVSKTRQENRKIDNIAPLHVPRIFFDSSFSLSDPITFHAVASLLNTTESSNSSPRNVSTSFHSFSDHAILPIHLCWDAVDESLREQVTCKSDDFFLENANFRKLEILVAQAMGDISNLRQEFHYLMSSLDEENSVLLMAELRLNLVQLYSVLEDVTSVIKSKQLVESMLLSRTAEADYPGAYNLASQIIAEIDKRPSISSCSSLMENNRFYCLVDILAVANIRNQLCRYQAFSIENAANVIVEMFISWKFINYEAVTLSTRSTIKNLIAFLSDIKQLSLIDQRYTFRLSEMVYVTVKTTLEECVTESSIRKAHGLPSTNRRQFQDGFQPQDSNVVDENVSLSSALLGISTDVFSECLKMIFEQISRLLRCSSLVMEFLDREGIYLYDINYLPDIVSQSNESSINVIANEHCSSVAKTTAYGAASELCISLISDLFSARKEVASFIKFEEMQHIWKICTNFSNEIEELNAAYAPSAGTLRALLLTQAKAFIDQQHISHMTTLAACLDSEKWVQCLVSAERQYAIDNLCGKGTSRKNNSIDTQVADEKRVQKNLNEAIIGERKYKVVWSCLLLTDLIISDIEYASFFENLSLSIAKKITELLRLFNARTKQMVLGAGALRSGAQLQSINTKHLALTLQCIDYIADLIPCIQSVAVRNSTTGNSLSETSAFVTNEFLRVQKEYDKHREMIFEKFVTIIKAVVQHSLAPQISSTDFDKRAEQFSSDIGSEKSGDVVQVCPFLEGLLTNASMMHQVLSSILPQSQVEDVFLRIFTYIDQQVPILFVMATQSATSRADATKDIKIKNIQPCFSFPKKRNGMRRMLEEIIWTTVKLNQLSGIRPFTFTMASMLGKKMGVVKKSNASSISSTAKDPMGTDFK